MYLTASLRCHRQADISTDQCVIGAEKSVTENFIGEKEKLTNKENDKQEKTDSLLHNTTSYTQHLYQRTRVSQANIWPQNIIIDNRVLHTI